MKDTPRKKSSSNEENRNDNQEQVNFRVLAEMTSSAIIIFNGVNILFVNPAAEKLTGYSHKELMKMDFHDLFTVEAKKVIKHWGVQIRKDKSFSAQKELKIETKNGEERWVKLIATGIDFGKKTAMLATATDITEHKRAEILQDAVYRIAQAADHSKKLEDLFPAVHAIIEEVMNADNFYIALYENENKNLSFPYFIDEMDKPRAPGKPGKGLTEYVLRTGKSILVDLAIHNELIKQGEIELIGNPSPIWLGVPLIVDNKVIGAMVVQHYTDPKAYGTREKRILEFVSSQVARVIYRKRTEDALRESEDRFHRRADELTGLYETAQDLASQKDLKTLLSVVADRVTSLIRSPGCSIYLYDKERKDLEVVIARGLQRLAGVRLQMGEGLAGKVAQTLQPIVVEDYRKWKSRSAQFEKLPIAAVAEVPMIYSGELIGVLTVYELAKANKRPTRIYTQSDLDLLSVFAGSAAVAVHNARLFEETRQRLLELEVLYQTSLAATQIVSSKAVAQRIVNTLAERMKWKSNSIWLIDPVQQKLFLLAHNKKWLKDNSEAGSESQDSLTIEMGQGILGQVCLSGQALRTGDVTTIPAFIDKEIGTKSELCIPLKVGGKTIGCINIESPELNAFSDHDERILYTLAAQAATAIDNANLYKEALQASERRSILHQASQELARASQDPEQVYVATHKAATQLMVADTFVITLYDEIKKEIQGVYLIDLGERHSNNVLKVGQGISGKVITSGKSILIQDFNKTKNGIKPYLFGSRGMTRSVLAVPMRSGERIIGMISAQSYRPNIYTIDDAVLLEMLAAHAGAALENARLFEETRKRLTEQELLYQASLSTIQIQSVKDVAQRIVAAIEKLLDWNGSIWINENQKPMLLAQCEMGLSGEALQNELKRIDESITSLDDGIIGWVCENGKVFRTGDVASETRYKKVYGNVKSEMCVPIKAGRKTIGCITVVSELSNAFSMHDERLLVTLANQASVAIENARLFEETQRRAIRQVALNAIITVSARTGADLDEILNTTLAQTLTAFSLDMGTIWLSWSSHGIQRIVTKNIPQSINTLIAKSVLSSAKSQTKVNVVDDWRTAKNKNADQFNSAGIQSTIIVPLLSSENRIGGMTIASPVVRKWTAEEIALVEAIGREVGSAAERAKLFKETSSRLDELEVVSRVSASLRLANSLKEMLPQLIDEALKTLGVEAGAIWLYDSDWGKLYQSIGRGWCTQTANLELDIHEGLPGSTFTTSDIFFSRDLAQDRLTSPTIRKFVPQGWSAIFLPIHSEQRPIGVIMASTKLPREFSGENARLLVTLTEIAGNAIHRMRLNEQLVQHAEELEIRVTERTAELQSALRKSQAADRLKSEFIANVNHELRTPLTNLILYYQMLRAQPSVKADERLDVIGRELQRLRSLIEDLLNLSRFDLGKMRLHPMPCDLNALIQTLVNDRRSLAEDRGLSLQINLLPGLAPIWFDEATIIQALSNLLTNAMNYTPHGGSILVSTLTGEYANETWAGFRVEDTGRGIDNEDMPHLFERFYRGKAGHESGAPGTGLGLAIVKQVVEHHQGRIEVENAIEGHGAVFTIWLPTKKTQETS
jgi:PAS domain S-box-containing protein